MTLVGATKPIDDTIDPRYEKLVERVLESKSSALIQNASGAHARSIIRALISKIEIEGYIGIFTENLNKHGFAPPSILSAFKKKLDEKILLKVLFQKRPDKEKFMRNPFFKEIIANQKYKDLIELRLLNKEHSKYDKHLITVSKGAFRAEEDHSKAKATVAFNNVDMGSEIRDLFESLFSDNYSTAYDWKSAEAAS